MSDWREDAIERWDRGHRPQWVLGEDEYGELWVPSLRRRDWWGHRFNARNPLHWPSWLLSRLTRRLAMIELVAPDA